jgi:hypothetical protein
MKSKKPIGLYFLSHSTTMAHSTTMKLSCDRPCRKQKDPDFSQPPIFKNKNSKHNKEGLGWGSSCCVSVGIVIAVMVDLESPFSIRGNILFTHCLLKGTHNVISAMILKPPLALRQHMIRHDWCEANLALGM